jgi:hypothetical protein
MKKYKVSIDGYTASCQYAIIQAESEQEALDIFNSGNVEYEMVYDDFEAGLNSEVDVEEIKEGSR